MIKTVHLVISELETEKSASMLISDQMILCAIAPARDTTPRDRAFN